MLDLACWTYSKRIGLRLMDLEKECWIKLVELRKRVQDEACWTSVNWKIKLAGFRGKVLD